MAIDINPIRPIQETSGTNPVSETRQAGTARSAAVEAEEAYAVSSSEKSNQFSIDYNKVRALKSDYRKGYGAFQQMVAALLQKQGTKSQDIMKKIFGENGDFSGVTDLGKTMASLNVDEDTRAQAASLIGDDGMLGVKQVSENILGFAKAVAGGDISKFQEMKAAFLKGFEQAERAWGGALPEISYRTKEAVLAGFDEWEKTISA